MEGRVFRRHREAEPRRLHAAQVQDARGANGGAIGAALSSTKCGVGTAWNWSEARLDVREPIAIDAGDQRMRPSLGRGIRRVGADRVLANRLRRGVLVREASG